MTEYICSNCDYIGESKIKKPGSRAMEIFLWAVFFIPGPFYTIWRMINKKHTCPHCGEDIMIPANSMLGQRRLKKMNDETSGETDSPLTQEWEKDIAKYQVEQAKEEKRDILKEVLQPIMGEKKNKVDKDKW